MTMSLSMKNSQFKTTADSENESWLIFDLESDLFPCLVDMRFLGVRVDVERAHK